MALIPPTVPEETDEVIETALASLLPLPDDDAFGRTLEDEKAAEPRLARAAPMPIYILSPEQALARTLHEATLMGWRHLLVRGDDVVGSIVLNMDASGDGLQFARLATGDYSTERLPRALATLDALETVAEYDYEARILRAPSLHFSSVWLHGSAQDIFVMLHDADHLRENQVYPLEEVVDWLANAARAIEGVSNAPKGPLRIRGQGYSEPKPG